MTLTPEAPPDIAPLPCDASEIVALFVQEDDDPWLAGAQIALQPDSPREAQLWLWTAGPAPAATATLRDSSGVLYGLLAFEPVQDKELVESILQDARDRGTLADDLVGHLVDALALRQVGVYRGQVRLAAQAPPGIYQIEASLKAFEGCSGVQASTELQVSGLAGLQVSDPILASAEGSTTLRNIGNVSLVIVCGTFASEMAPEGQKDTLHYASALGERLPLQPDQPVRFQHSLPAGADTALALWQSPSLAADSPTGLTISAQAE
ncbi:MAG: hypothetical protein ACYC5M_02475 [Anaerolineae bacterium]